MMLASWRSNFHRIQFIYNPDERNSWKNPFVVPVEFGFSLVPPVQYLGLGMEGLIVCEPKPGVEGGVVWRKEMNLLTEGEALLDDDDVIMIMIL